MHILEKFKAVFIGPIVKGMLILGLTLTLSACGTDDVVLEGKLFEAAGISGSLNKKAKTPKIKARSGLILPPSAQLPEPGKRVAVQDEQNWPDDPDVRRRKAAALAEAERKEYCSEVGRNRNHPDFDEDKTAKCSSLLSGALSGFQRAPAPDQE